MNCGKRFAKFCPRMFILSHAQVYLRILVMMLCAYFKAQNTQRISTENLKLTDKLLFGVKELYLI